MKREHRALVTTMIGVQSPAIARAPARTPRSLSRTASFAATDMRSSTCASRTGPRVSR